MKKLVSVISLILAFTMLFAFAACSKGGESSSSKGGVTGKYKLVSIYGGSVRDYLEDMAEDAGMNFSIMLDRFGITESTLDEYYTLELKSDGTFIAHYAGRMITGTWTQEGDTITLTSDTGSENYTIKDGMLYGEYDNIVLGK